MSGLYYCQMKNKRQRVLRILVHAIAIGACALLCTGIIVAQKSRQKDVEEIADASPAAWKEFLSKEGGFAIQFPGIPKESSQSMGEVDVKMHQLHASFEYSVMYADYPDWANDSDPRLAKRILDSGLEGAVAETKSKLLEVEEISLDNHPGRRYTERMPDGSVLRGKTFLVGHRLYQVAITTPKEDGAIPEAIRLYEDAANKFLASFRLVAR